MSCLSFLTVFWPLHGEQCCTFFTIHISMFFFGKFYQKLVTRRILIVIVTKFWWVVWIAQNGKALVFVREVLGSNPGANRCWLRVDQRRPEPAICMHQRAVTHSGVW